ncbi:MAG: FkbM family methyltransferase [Acidobacteriota bacterium]|nr:FkbM family methyltransferase [Acidobacteriota bacterium]
MSTASRIRHSFAGKLARQMIHGLYHVKHPNGKPVKYQLPGEIKIELYPEGEIAEFLAFPQIFEQAELASVYAYLKPGMKVVDVGANIGLYSIFAQKVVGETGSVWAFEPSLETFQRLERNLALNECHQVKALRMGLGNKSNATLQLKSDHGFGDAYRYLAEPDNSSDSPLEGERVLVTTLDEWAQANDIGPIDFLKIDIEGGEYKMLLGSQWLLRSSPHLVVLFESDPQWCERAACSQQDSFRILESLGFHLYAWNKRSKQWVTDEAALLNAGMVWASAAQSTLPRIP